MSKTVRLLPTKIYRVEPSDLTVTNEAELLTNVDSSTYATIYPQSLNNPYVYVGGFDLSGIPKNSVSSYSVKFKSRNTSGSLSSSTKIIYNGDNVVDDQPSLPYGLYNFAKVNSFDNPIDWSELADIGENLNIKVPLKNNTYNYIYGVEIEVTYDPPVNKVVYGTTVLVDLTADTVTPETLMQGYTAHDKSGALITGTATGGGGGDSYTRTIVVPQQTVTPDSNRQFEFTYSSSFVDGEYYVVTFDGVEWLTTSETIWENEVVIGDASVPWNTSDTVYPFVMSSGTGYFTNTNQHTLKVELLEFVDGPLNLIAKSITSNGTYTASSDNADGYSSVTVNVPSSGGTDFVVTVSYNSTTGMWEPDCTYAEVSAAMGSGKSLSAKITSGVNGAADAEWNSNSNTMLYAVFATNSVAWYQYVYSLTAQGINLVYQGTANRYTLTVNASGRWEAAQFNAYGFDVVNVPDGTAGTPTATKGNVSNHSISVTPSVTNTDGWITGGTKTGTAVTVSASELVSGSETKTANGTYNVTNLASLVVDIPIVTYHTSSSAPTSAQGSDGDLWLVTA